MNGARIINATVLIVSTVMGVVIDMDYFMGLMVFICALLGITVVVAICRQGGKSEKYWGPFKKRLNCVGCGYVSYFSNFAMNKKK